ncbi:hypothetical protein B0T26DRAFT_639170 [Lasiosphaeria miniovina]|uniref:Aquaporin-like protein n=1 Tax=Lasiosphaeria miniovina TaxID=1954250 RepID=A0AA40B4X1_9PEZI|nr:uncharacterized protein B0T26DRAFT_639170 [Lasiosphaeria miniovina]KAK0727433.1 hypothetical protein B0T26DRAFT_639170 [Lasiosphaeria miniovina]
MAVTSTNTSKRLEADAASTHTVPDTDGDETRRELSEPVRLNTRTNNAAFDGAFDESFAGAVGNVTEASDLPWYRLREYFTEGWANPVIWRSTVDGRVLATASMIYISGQFGLTLLSYKTNHVAGYVGIFNTLLLATFIYAVSPATGGHLNPMITFTTILCGLTPLSRGVLLMVARIIGGILAGAMLLGSWGHERAISNLGGGSFFDPEFLSPGQALLTETMSSLCLLLLAVSTGLDPRRQVLYGRQLGPLLFSLSLSFISSAASGGV